MPIELESNYVFLDTSVFVKANFNFESSTFKKLISLIGERKVFLLSTDITLKEIQSNIEGFFQKAVNSLQSFKNKGKILRNLKSTPWIEIFATLDENIIRKQLNNQFQTFLKSAKVESIPCDSTSIEKVFYLYFNQKPPFSEGKKKAEFPDAFTLESIKSWCHQKNSKIYVISTDDDWKKACEQDSALIYLSSIEEFLDLIARENDLYRLVDQALISWRILECIENKIKENLEEAEYLLEDRDGEVIDVSIKNISIDDPYIINIENEYGDDEVFIEAEYEADIEIEAGVEYLDEDADYYDREYPVMRHFITKHEITHKTIDISIDVEVAFDRNNPDDFRIQSVYIPKDQFSIKIDKDRGWP